MRIQHPMYWWTGESRRCYRPLCRCQSHCVVLNTKTTQCLPRATCTSDRLYTGIHSWYAMAYFRRIRRVHFYAFQMRDHCRIGILAISRKRGKILRGKIFLENAREWKLIKRSFESMSIKRYFVLNIKKYSQFVSQLLISNDIIILLGIRLHNVFIYWECWVLNRYSVFCSCIMCEQYAYRLLE